MRGIDCAHFLSMENYPNPDSGNGVGIRAKKVKFSIFASIHQLHSLNQSQDNFCILRECAQSIPRIKLPPDGCFQGENRSFFDFRINTPNPSPESGSRKRFHASGMRVIDFPHKITPILVILS
jgi:hypothetical protein